MRFPLQTIMDPFSILDTDAADNTEPSTPRPMQTSHHDEQAPRSSPASTLEFHDVRGDPPNIPGPSNTMGDALSRSFNDTCSPHEHPNVTPIHEVDRRHTEPIVMLQSKVVSLFTYHY